MGIYEDLFKIEYERLRIFKKLGISNLLLKIFNKQNSYLNILEFKKNLDIDKKINYEKSIKAINKVIK